MTFDKLCEIEDHLQSKMVFESGFNPGQCAHMDSYMTIINYQNLEAVLNSDVFSKEDWLNACKEWEKVEYLSPIIKLLRLIVERKFQKLS